MANAARDAEGHFVEGELAVPAFGHGLLGLGQAEFLQDLFVVFFELGQGDRQGIWRGRVQVGPVQGGFVDALGLGRKGVLGGAGAAVQVGFAA